MNPLNVVMICITMLGCVLVLSSTEDPDPDAEYCEMVKIYKESNGQYGWNAYKGEDICK